MEGSLEKPAEGVPERGVYLLTKGYLASLTSWSLSPVEDTTHTERR